MNHREILRGNRVYKERQNTEAIDLLKGAFVLISIPIVVFALTYMTLDTIMRMLFG